MSPARQGSKPLTLRLLGTPYPTGPGAPSFLGNFCAATPRTVRPPQRPTEVIAAPIIPVLQWGFFMKFHRAVNTLHYRPH